MLAPLNPPPRCLHGRKDAHKTIQLDLDSNLHFSLVVKFGAVRSQWRGTLLCPASQRFPATHSFA